jgi:hypothetical protein
MSPYQEFDTVVLAGEDDPRRLDHGDAPCGPLNGTTDPILLSKRRGLVEARLPLAGQLARRRLEGGPLGAAKPEGSKEGRLARPTGCSGDRR